MPLLSFAGEGARATLHEGAAGVASPDAIGGPAMEANAFVQGIGLAQSLSGALLGSSIVDDQFYSFVAR